MTPSAFGIDSLGRVLDTAALRHRVIANNVANVNTPGFRTLEVSFEDELAQAKVVEASDRAERVDGNNVDIDREMNDLSKNALLYQAATQIAASRVASLRAAIAGR